jgi:hypothetical protein
MSTQDIVVTVILVVSGIAVAFGGGYACAKTNTWSREERLQRDNDRLSQRDRDISWKYNQSTAIARALCSQEMEDDVTYADTP